MQIIPAVLNQKFDDAQEKIKLVKDLSNWIQIDVIDGVLTEGKTFELELLTKLNFNTEDILWDIHLMTKDPVKWINKCEFVGANRVIGQVEMMSDREQFVSELKDRGMEAGLAFDVDSVIDDDIPEDTDIVLVMGRKLGYGDYQFDKNVLQKIDRLKQIRTDKGLRYAIGIDGGVNTENIETLSRNSVSIVYCGGSVFSGNVKENWEELSKLI